MDVAGGGPAASSDAVGRSNSNLDGPDGENSTMARANKDMWIPQRTFKIHTGDFLLPEVGGISGEDLVPDAKDANALDSSRFPMTVRFLKLQRLCDLFREREAMAGVAITGMGLGLLAGGGGLLAGAGKAVGGLFRGGGGDGTPRGGGAERSQLPTIKQLTTIYQECLREGVSVSQQLELVFKQASEIALALTDEYPEIWGQEKMTRFQRQFWWKNLSPEQQQQEQMQEQHLGDEFIATLERIHKTFASTQKTIAPILYRTLAKLSVLAGQGSGELGFKAISCLAQFFTSDADVSEDPSQIVSLVQELLLPEIELLKYDHPLCEGLIKGLVRFFKKDRYRSAELFQLAWRRPVVTLNSAHGAAALMAGGDVGGSEEAGTRLLLRNVGPTVVAKICEFLGNKDASRGGSFADGEIRLSKMS